MGFEERTYVLVWPEDSTWHGLEVRVRGMTIDELEIITEMRALADETQTAIGKIKPVMAIMADGIVEWNYTKKGVPVPIAEISHQDAAMVTNVIQAWMNVGEVSAPLDTGSASGKQLETALIPMEIPLSSHPS